MRIHDYFGEGTIVAPPQVESSMPAITGFVVCPVGLHPFGTDLAMIYRLAYARAQAALRPTRYERLYRVSPN
jgi:hypothetical protein